MYVSVVGVLALIVLLASQVPPPHAPSALAENGFTMSSPAAPAVSFDPLFDSVISALRREQSRQTILELKFRVRLTKKVCAFNE